MTDWHRRRGIHLDESPTFLGGECDACDCQITSGHRLIPCTFHRLPGSGHRQGAPLHCVHCSATLRKYTHKDCHTHPDTRYACTRCDYTVTARVLHTVSALDAEKRLVWFFGPDYRTRNDLDCCLYPHYGSNLIVSRIPPIPGESPDDHAQRIHDIHAHFDMSKRDWDQVSQQTVEIWDKLG